MSENFPVPFSSRLPFSTGFLLLFPQSLGSTWYIIGLFISSIFCGAKIRQIKCLPKSFLSKINYLCTIYTKIDLRTPLHIFILIFLSLFTSSVLSAETTGAHKQRNYDYTLGVNLRPSYVMPTHGFYNGWNPTGKKIKAGGALDMQYAFSKKG